MNTQPAKRTDGVMSRRSLLPSLAAVPLLAGATGVARAQSAGNPARFHLGAVTYNVLKDMPLGTLIDTLEKNGYEAVELRTTHKHGVEPSLDGAARQQVRQAFQGRRVRLLSYGTTCEFHSPDAGTRQAQVQLAKQFVDLAKDTGALGVKVRPNGLPAGVPHSATIANIGNALREVGEYAQPRNVEIWVEVHGPQTSAPPIMADIMKATKHKAVGLCWNSNPGDVSGGSVRASFELLQPWIKSVHINELSSQYPWRELFMLLSKSGYDRYTLCEVADSPDPERFLQYYRALWTELTTQHAG